MVLKAMEAVDRQKDVTIGWRVDPAEREVLLARFRPRYQRVVANHVTLKTHVDPSTLLPTAHSGEIVGRVDDGSGVEAMVVRINGTTERPGGGAYHITWSLGPDRKAVESNDALAKLGWTPLPEPVAVSLDPARFFG